MIRKSRDFPVLRRSRMSMGIGARSATMLWMMSLMVGMVIELPWGLLMAVPAFIIHMALTWAFRSDPEIFNLYAVHERMPNDLHAGAPYHGAVSISRPKGYFKEVPR